MRFWPILKDSFYETIDFKIFYVLLAFSLLFALICLSFTFPAASHDEILGNTLLRDAGPMFAGPPRQRGQENGRQDVFLPGGAAAEVSDFRVIDEAGSSGRYAFTMMPRRPDVYGLALRAAAKQRNLIEQASKPGANFTFADILKQALPDKAPTTAAEWTTAVEEHLNSFKGIDKAKVIALDTTDTKAPTHVQAEADIDWTQMPYSRQLGILFGVWKIDVPSIGMVVSLFQIGFSEWVAGWAGIIVALICSAAFVPNMLQKGTVDLLLVKPIYRSELLVYKYIGGLMFVLFNATVLVTGTWAAFAINTGNWSPWYLASIPILVFYFAILYSCSVLLGVLSRSAIVAILGTIGFWFVLYLINSGYTLVHMNWGELLGREGVAVPPVLVSMVDWIHFVLPKPSTLSQLNQMALLKANEATDMLNQQRAFTNPEAEISWTETICTSGGFIVIMLAIACWRFARKDY